MFNSSICISFLSLLTYIYIIYDVFRNCKGFFIHFYKLLVGSWLVSAGRAGGLVGCGVLAGKAVCWLVRLCVGW